MASVQVEITQVEEFTKPSEETMLGSPAIEGSEKAPAPHNFESPYDENDEDVILPDELGKQEDLDDQKALGPQIIEDEDDEDDDDDEKRQDEEPALKSAGRAIDFSEEEAEDDD